MFSRTPRLVSILLVILIFLITSITIYSISSETQTALKESIQEKLMTVASLAASEIDGDSFARLDTGDENTTEFIRIRDILHNIKDVDPEVRFIYTMRKSKDSVEFVVDGDYGYSHDAAKLGEVYPEAQKELLSGFSAPSVDLEFTTDQWGTVLSGYSPIRNSTGAVVGIVGIDMESSAVLAKLNRVNVMLYLVGIVAMIFAAIGIIVVERRRMIDEQNLEASEKKYRLLFERAGDAILMIEAEGNFRGKIVAANTAAAEMHGYTVEEMLTKSIVDLNPAEFRKELEKRSVRLLNNEWLKDETLHIRKDRTIFPVEINASLLIIGTKKFILVIERDITERKNAEHALQQVTKKLSLLNNVTFNDIQNAVFSLSGFLSLEKIQEGYETSKKYVDKEEESVRKIMTALTFAKSYQDLGVNPPRWQNINHSFIYAISHLDFSSVHRTVNLDNIEIFADSLLERVFFTLAEHVLQNAKTLTELTVSYQLIGDDLIIIFEDNGNGIPDAMKEKIFERGYEKQKGMELFLVREILGITGISIRETGTFGKGTRFEILVPRGAYRFPNDKSN